MEPAIKNPEPWAAVALCWQWKLSVWWETHGFPTLIRFKHKGGQHQFFMKHKTAENKLK